MKCKNGHRTPKGYRELEGAELEAEFKRQEAAGIMERVKRRGPPRPGDEKMCLHVYVKK